MGATKPTVLLSFDLEEFDIPGEYGKDPSPAEEFGVPLEGLWRILALLHELGLPATFFCTVRYLASQPGLGRRLVDLGHEVASHGYCHRHFSLEDLVRSREHLESVIGQPVRGYRSARFRPVSPEALRAAGYSYDSSVHPTLLPGRYNQLAFPRTPFWFSGLPELPVSVSPVLRYPFFWLSFKNFPFWWHWALSWCSLRKDGYLLLLFHPWEFASLEKFVELPCYVRKPCGEELLGRLADYLKRLRGEALFCTCWEFSQKRFGG
jgi:peptidoglycan/xylan/chitin deacetylase (PgdA/CDA1 family)